MISKLGLLGKYITKPVTDFYQFDGFNRAGKGGTWTAFGPDKDGYCLFASLTQELMSGDPDVRILVKRGTSVETAVTLVERLLALMRKCSADDYSPPDKDEGTFDLEKLFEEVPIKGLGPYPETN